MIGQGIYLLLQGTSAVTTIAPKGGFWEALPKDFTLPSWTYNIASNPGELVLSGPVELSRARLQIDAYGNGAEVIRLAKAIDTALHGFKGTLTDDDQTYVDVCERSNMMDAFDIDARTNRRMLEYYIWHT